MIQILSAYVATTIVFLGLDILGLKFIVKPVFDRHISDLYADPFRMGPAAIFYLAYVAGAIYLVSLPALRNDAPLQALVNGAVLGALAYGTYEFTSLAVMRDWSWEQVITDTLWGTVLTGVSVWAGVMIARWIG
ncbi:DUF2177 family protein [Thioclava sp. GXIMD4216]|uniref:DUF2177 family protein n=1 Tax=Thioclava sp. GXIMD4216 TaxID=3131929 RepID=UPI0030D029C4